MMASKIPDNFTTTALPARITTRVTNLSAQNHRNLLKKRKWLHDYSVVIPSNVSTQQSPAFTSAVLVFAQEEAGTAVCISPSGVLLTCSHCVAETQADLNWDKVHWLLFASGQLVTAKAMYWDPRRDLAVLYILQAAVTGDGTTDFAFPYVSLMDTPPVPKSRLLCIGHPGSEDLEADMPGVQTNYDVLVLSEGNYLGLAEGQDAQDNSDIGALKHTCWTYWGHSGAPLIDRKSGLMVGMHSSWDEETGIRRGISWEAIVALLANLEKEVKSKEPDGWVQIGRTETTRCISNGE